MIRRGVTTHTPGPWHLDEAESEATVYVPKNGDHDDQREVATVKILRFVPDHAKEDLANANLIKAAPDLLAALKRVIQAFDVEAIDDGEPWDSARAAFAAIAKAEGEEPDGD